MRIDGIGAEEAYRFSLQQWVNVWLLNGSDCEFYGSCQVYELDELLEDADIEDFGLEPVDQAGNVMSVKEALL